MRLIEVPFWFLVCLGVGGWCNMNTELTKKQDRSGADVRSSAHAAWVQSSYAVVSRVIEVPGGLCLVDGISRHLKRLDAATGRELWSSESGYVSGRSAALAVDAAGETIYLATGGRVEAYRARSGEKLWSRIVMHPMGAAEELLPPLVASGEHLIVASALSRVIVLDAGSGALRWREDAERPGLTAQAFAVSGPTLLTLTDRGVTAEALADGEPLWLRSFGAALPVGLVLRLREVWARLQDSDPVYLLDAAGVVAVERESGRERWRYSLPGLTSVARAGSVLVVAGEGGARGLDAATGSQRWLHQGPAQVAPLTEQSVLIQRGGGAVVVGASDGSLRAELEDLGPHDTGVLAAGDGRVVLQKGRQLRILTAQPHPADPLLLAGSYAQPAAFVLHDATVIVESGRLLQLFP